MTLKFYLCNKVYVNYALINFYFYFCVILYFATKTFNVSIPVSLPCYNRVVA